MSHCSRPHITHPGLLLSLFDLALSETHFPRDLKIQLDAPSKSFVQRGSAGIARETEPWDKLGLTAASLDLLN
jgi:hypothetical protein